MFFCFGLLSTLIIWNKWGFYLNGICQVNEDFANWFEKGHKTLLLFLQTSNCFYSFITLCTSLEKLINYHCLLLITRSTFCLPFSTFLMLRHILPFRFVYYLDWWNLFTSLVIKMQTECLLEFLSSTDKACFQNIQEGITLWNSYNSLKWSPKHTGVIYQFSCCNLNVFFLKYLTYT